MYGYNLGVAVICGFKILAADSPKSMGQRIVVVNCIVKKLVTKTCS